MLDPDETLASLQRGDARRTGAHEGIADQVGTDISDDLVHHLVGLHGRMIIFAAATDLARNMPLLRRQFADGMMAMVPGVDIDFAICLIMLVRHRHGVRLDPHAQREPVETALQIGRQLRHLIIVAEDDDGPAEQGIDDLMIYA